MRTNVYDTHACDDTVIFLLHLDATEERIYIVYGYNVTKAYFRRNNNSEKRIHFPFSY